MDLDIDVHAILLDSVAHLRGAAGLAAQQQPGVATRLREVADRIDPHHYAPATEARSTNDSLRAALAALDGIPQDDPPAAVALIRAAVIEALRGTELT